MPETGVGAGPGKGGPAGRTGAGVCWREDVGVRWRVCLVVVVFGWVSAGVAAVTPAPARSRGEAFAVGAVECAAADPNATPWTATETTPVETVLERPDGLTIRGGGVPGTLGEREPVVAVGSGHRHPGWPLLVGGWRPSRCRREFVPLRVRPGDGEAEFDRRRAVDGRPPAGCVGVRQDPRPDGRGAVRRGVRVDVLGDAP